MPPTRRPRPRTAPVPADPPPTGPAARLRALGLTGTPAPVPRTGAPPAHPPGPRVHIPHPPYALAPGAPDHRTAPVPFPHAREPGPVSGAGPAGGVRTTALPGPPDAPPGPADASADTPDDSPGRPADRAPGPFPGGRHRRRTTAPPSGFTEVDADELASPPGPFASVGSWAERALLTRRNVYSLVAVCAMAVLATVWFAFQTRPDTVSAPELLAQAGPAPTGQPSPPHGPPEPPADVTVHVGGEVRSPGVHTLPAGSRVADAVEAAGGALPGADTDLLNLARPLVDGEQVLVGVPPPPGAGPEAAGAAAVLDLNTATARQLEELPGIGPVMAERIIAHRTEKGPFTSVEQLREVSGIGDRRFADISGLVHVPGSG